MVQFHRDKPTLLLGKYAQYGWKGDYRFLDAMDIDGDKVPELVFEVKGYEATSYAIYKLVNGRFQEVLLLAAYGC